MGGIAFLILVATTGEAPGAGGPGAGGAGGFARRLVASGRATARIERRAPDPLTGGVRASRGRLALEPPDRARLEFAANGEVLTLRGDGGEWLQPDLRQMIRLGPRSAAAGLRWWGALLGGPEAIGGRALPGRRYAVATPGGEAPGADTAWVTLDPRGLPEQLEYEDAAGGRVRFRFSSWRFGPARGRAAFALDAPGGFEVVDVP
jgi:hypothetical protein